MNKQPEWLNQNGWINNLLSCVQEDVPEDIRLIEHCGKCCASDSGHLEGAAAMKKLAEGCKTRSDYAAFMRGHFPFEVEEQEDGIIIHYGKTECTCKMAPGVSNSALCNCTLGHEKAMWSIVFDREIDAEIVESFQRRGNDCVLKIFI